MGTPEDVAAEKYFTPPTLTEMLIRAHLPVPTTKKVVTDWLKTVGLTDYFGYGKDRYRFNITESLRQLLIMLVDEP